MRRASAAGVAATALLAVAATACLDTSNIARTDQPPALLAVEDSLQREHFSGLVVVERPRDGVLRLRFRDPSRCGRPPASLERFARDVSARAVALYRPPRGERTAAVDSVEVLVRRTHRFGAVVWTTSLGEFTHSAARLDSLAVPALPSCGTLPPLLRGSDG